MTIQNKVILESNIYQSLNPKILPDNSIKRRSKLPRNAFSDSECTKDFQGAPHINTSNCDISAGTQVYSNMSSENIKNPYLENIFNKNFTKDTDFLCLEKFTVNNRNMSNDISLKKKYPKYDTFFESELVFNDNGLPDVKDKHDESRSYKSHWSDTLNSPTEDSFMNKNSKNSFGINTSDGLKDSNVDMENKTDITNLHTMNSKNTNSKKTELLKNNYNAYNFKNESSKISPLTPKKEFMDSTTLELSSPHRVSIDLTSNPSLLDKADLIHNTDFVDTLTDANIQNISTISNVNSSNSIIIHNSSVTTPQLTPTDLLQSTNNPSLDKDRLLRKYSKRITFSPKNNKNPTNRFISSALSAGHNDSFFDFSPISSKIKIKTSKQLNETMDTSIGNTKAKNESPQFMQMLSDGIVQTESLGSDYVNIKSNIYQSLNPKILPDNSIKRRSKLPRNAFSDSECTKDFQGAPHINTSNCDISAGTQVYSNMSSENIKNPYLENIFNKNFTKDTDFLCLEKFTVNNRNMSNDISLKKKYPKYDTFFESELVFNDNGLPDVKDKHDESRSYKSHWSDTLNSPTEDSFMNKNSKNSFGINTSDGLKDSNVDMENKTDITNLHTMNSKNTNSKKTELLKNNYNAYNFKNESSKISPLTPKKEFMDSTTLELSSPHRVSIDLTSNSPLLDKAGLIHNTDFVDTLTDADIQNISTISNVNSSNSIIIHNSSVTTPQLTPTDLLQSTNNPSLDKDRLLRKYSKRITFSPKNNKNPTNRFISSALSAGHNDSFFDFSPISSKIKIKTSKQLNETMDTSIGNTKAKNESPQFMQMLSDGIVQTESLGSDYVNISNVNDLNTIYKDCSPNTTYKHRYPYCELDRNANIKTTENKIPTSFSNSRPNLYDSEKNASKSPLFYKLEKVKAKSKRRLSLIKTPKSLELDKKIDDGNKDFLQNSSASLNPSNLNNDIENRNNQPELTGSPLEVSNNYLNLFENKYNNKRSDEIELPAYELKNQLENYVPIKSPLPPPFKEALDKRNTEMEAWKCKYGTLSSWKYDLTLKVPYESQMETYITDLNNKKSKEKSPNNKSSWSTGILEKFNKTRSRSLAPPDSQKDFSYDILAMSKDKSFKFRSIFPNDQNASESLLIQDKKKNMKLKKIFFSASQDKPKDNKIEIQHVAADLSKKSRIPEITKDSLNRHRMTNSLQINHESIDISKNLQSEKPFNAEIPLNAQNLKNKKKSCTDLFLKNLKQIKSNKIFDVPLHEAVNNSMIVPGIPLPAIFIRCIEYLEKFGLKEIGLYRISGGTKSVNAIKTLFANGYDIDLEEIVCDVHNVSSLLKAYLREIPESLTTIKLESEFNHLNEIYSICCRSEPTKQFNTSKIIQDSEFLFNELKKIDELKQYYKKITDIRDSDLSINKNTKILEKNDHDNKKNTTTTAKNVYKNKKEWLGGLSELIHKLPSANFVLLKWLFLHLSRVVYYSSYNKMTLSNLSIIFCTTLRMNGHIFSEMVLNSEFIFKEKNYIKDENKITKTDLVKPVINTITKTLSENESNLNQISDDIGQIGTPIRLEENKVRRSSENTLLRSEYSNETDLSDNGSNINFTNIYSTDIFKDINEKNEFISWIQSGKSKWINAIRSNKLDKLMYKILKNKLSDTTIDSVDSLNLENFKPGDHVLQSYANKNFIKNSNTTEKNKKILTNKSEDKSPYYLLDGGHTASFKNRLLDRNVATTNNNLLDNFELNFSTENRLKNLEKPNSSKSFSLKKRHSSLDLLSKNSKSLIDSEKSKNIRNSNLKESREQVNTIYREQPYSSIPIIETNIKNSDPSINNSNYDNVDIFTESITKTYLSKKISTKFELICNTEALDIEQDKNLNVDTSRNKNLPNTPKTAKDTHISLYELDDNNYFKDITFEADNHFLKSPILSPKISESSFRSKINSAFAESEIFGQNNNSYTDEPSRLALKNYGNMQIISAREDYDPFNSLRNSKKNIKGVRNNRLVLPEYKKNSIASFFENHSIIGTKKNSTLKRQTYGVTKAGKN
ncbi:hypothetical protein BB561_003897 [Smittium simulii]|uniref:Rho-GAP domain-containing protein n=1 Tax=Smittium simulii TaxID=133385 RepID=A0A2T9YJ13_9FUNG|nr:hypothetical protein BB561_003897 [Smittium simulii]